MRAKLASALLLVATSSLAAVVEAPNARRNRRSELAQAGTPPAGHLLIPSRRRVPPLRERPDQELLELLGRGAWVLDPVANHDPMRPECPWRHPAVHVLVERCRSDPARRVRIVRELRAAVEGKKDPFHRFNGAVALAALGVGDALPVLSRMLLDDAGDSRAKSTRLPRRTAAIFELARFPEALDPRALARCLDRWYPGIGRSGTPIPRGDGDAATSVGASRSFDASTTMRSRWGDEEHLIAGLLWAFVGAQSRRGAFDPTTDERLLSAAGSDSASVRRVAALAYAESTWEPIPQPLVRLLRDNAPAVRRAALGALLRHPTESGRAALMRATSDTDIAVRLHAIELLAVFEHAETTERLTRLLSSGAIVERVAAARSAGSLRLEGLLVRATRDDAVRVRETVARQFAGIDSPAAREALARLLHDRSWQVQVAAVESISRLATPAAVAMLLDGIESPTLRTRVAAAAALAAHWPDAAEFPTAERPDVRKRLVGELRERWERANPPTAAPSVGRAEPTGLDDEGADAVRRILRAWYAAGAVDRHRLSRELVGLGPPAVVAIEAFFDEHDSYPGPPLLRRVLAPIDPVYAGISRLWHSDERTESRAVSLLAGELEHRRLTAIQAVAVSQHLLRSTGVTAWLRLAPLVDRDAPELTPLLGTAGARHASAQVRQAACARLGRDADHAQLLERLFRDSSPQVRIAALRAAGHTRNDALTGALNEAIATPDARARLAAAASLQQLGDRLGAEQLRLLTRDSDPKIRRDALREFIDQWTATTGPAKRSDRLIPQDLRTGTVDPARLLMRALGDPKPEIRNEGLSGLEALTGRTFAFEQGKPTPTAEQVAKWKAALETEMLSRQLAN